MIQLFEHQKAAIEKLHSGAVLVGGVGSGKSLTALAYYYSKVCGGKSPILGDGYLPMQVDIPLYIITTARKRDSCDWTKESTNFPFMPKVVDSWNNIQKYVGIKNSFFFFDEQRVVGSGQWVKSFLKIAANNQWILLSATPGDTWLDYIPVFVANGFYKNRTEFMRRHVVFNHFSKFPKVDHYVEIQRLVKARDSILVNMHYVKPTHRKYIDVICDYDILKNQQLIVDRWNFYEECPVKDAGELCYLMRRLANSDISRMCKLMEIFFKFNKIIIFYNFNYELDILENWAKSTGLKYAQWNGHKHEEIPEGESWVYLCQYTAASEAWNCTTTNCIVFFSQNYSYKIMEQSAGRIDRMNTSFTNLFYFNFISKSPIDQAIRKALKQKRNFNESRFAGIT